MDPIARLQTSIDQTRKVIDGVRPTDMAEPSTCPDWDVRALSNHLLGALVMFEGVANNGAADMAAIESDHVGGDLADGFERLAAAAVSAWSVPGRVDGVANMPWGEMPAGLAVQMLADDVLVHGWDLARATGQTVDWDQELAAETLEFAQMMFATPAIRTDTFGDPVPVAEDADPMTQLVAFLGRTP